MATAKTGAKKKTTAQKAPLKDPKGGLTAAGRQAFKKSEGSNLKPGVKGAADTPVKMRRKGSFLRRHFASPRGPMVDEKGEPTRLALSAHAWGEPVPKTLADAKKLAAKGARLLKRYEASKTAAAPKRKPASKTTAAPKRKPASQTPAAPKRKPASQTPAAPKRKPASKTTATTKRQPAKKKAK